MSLIAVLDGLTISLFHWHGWGAHRVRPPPDAPANTPNRSTRYRNAPTNDVVGQRVVLYLGPANPGDKEGLIAAVTSLPQNRQLICSNGVMGRLAG
jgi:hypothetical protein